MTESEAFEIWYQAFLKNYEGTRLVEGNKTLAEQAWKAALNFAEAKEESTILSSPLGAVQFVSNPRL